MVDFRHHSQMTDALTVPRNNVASTVPGMAHFAGTGPIDKSCGDCAFFVIPERRKKPICEKYRQMTGDGAKVIPAMSPACRYFEQRQKI